MLYTQAITNTVCISANCLKTQRWGAFLGKLLDNLNAGICSVAEARLRNEDLARISFGNYVSLADYCRPTPGGEWIAGGVIILVRENFTAEEPSAISDLPEQLDYCPTKFYPTANPHAVMKVSGLYISPPNTRRVDTGKDEHKDEYTGDVIPHI